MKKLIPTILTVLVVAGALAWLALNLRAKRKYDELRDRLAQCSYSLVKMDSDTTALLAEACADWTEAYSHVGGPHSDALKTVGLRPSVSNLTHVFTHRLPEYSFLSPNQNKKSVVMGAIQSLLFSVTIDDAIHLSGDGSIALIRCQTNLVLVFADEESGLRESMYYAKKQDIEQDESTVPSKAAPSASFDVR